MGGSQLLAQIAKQFAARCRRLAATGLLFGLAYGLAQELAVESRMLLEQWVESLVAIAQQAIAQRLDTVEMLAKQLVLLLEPGEGRGDAVDVLAPHLFTDELQLAAPRFALFEAPVEIDGFDYFLAQG